MTDNPFRKATKTQAKLRMALAGPSGSGKTYTGLIFATALADGGRVAVIDTERGSSAKFSDIFDFDILDMRERYSQETFDPRNYVECILEAEAQGYDVVLIDSLSHAWVGLGGALELQDKAARRYSGNKWAAWADVTPIHRRLVDTMLQSNCHVIATMRSKTVYAETVENGRKRIKKLGTAPVQRPGMDYEFDIVGEIDVEHRLYITKTRFPAVADKEQLKPDAKWFAPIKAWLTEGAPAPEKPGPQPAATPKSATGWASWSDKAHGAFIDKARSLGETDLIHQAFGVTKIEEYGGTTKDAGKIFSILEYGLSKTLNVDEIEEALGGTIAGWYGRTLDEAQERIQVWQANAEAEDQDEIAF